MVVWEPGRGQNANALDRADGRSWIFPGVRSGNLARANAGRQLSRQMRVTLEFLIAILSALASSYLILRLGL